MRRCHRNSSPLKHPCLLYRQAKLWMLGGAQCFILEGAQMESTCQPCSEAKAMLVNKASSSWRLMRRRAAPCQRRSRKPDWPRMLICFCWKEVQLSRRYSMDLNAMPPLWLPPLLQIKDTLISAPSNVLVEGAEEQLFQRAFF